MKKAFSLIELVIAVSILSVVMLSLIQIRSNNINLIKKVKEKAILSDYILLAMDLKKPSNRNKDIRLGDIYRFKNDDLRRDLKQVKVKVKDKKLETIVVPILDNIEVNINIFSSSYSIDDKMKKNIYSFNIEPRL